MGVLSRLFRRLVLEKLAAAHGAGALQFFGKHASLTNARAFAAYLAPLRNSEWVVYSKRPFGGPKEVLRYLRAIPIVSPSPIAASFHSTTRASPSSGRITASKAPNDTR